MPTHRICVEEAVVLVKRASIVRKGRLILAIDIGARVFAVSVWP